MQLGMIGLGRMGANMVRRLMKAGHRCVVYDVNPQSVAALVAEGATGAESMADLVAKLSPPHAVWLMLPAAITSGIARDLAGRMEAGDTLIDGGNSHYHDAVDLAAEFSAKGVSFVDVGTSGGVWGLERGYSLMIGGPDDAVARLDPIFAALAPGADGSGGKPGTAQTAAQGYLHCGPSGAGHFVKMVHNGIEYGMMQAYAEGFDILRNKDSTDLPEDERFELNITDIAEVWRRGSVISSWLLDLSAIALAKDPELAEFSGYVQDSGEGRWTVEAAIEEAVPADVLSTALFARFRSRQDHNFAEKILSAMRFGFGGHVEGAEAIDPEKKIDAHPSSVKHTRN